MSETTTADPGTWIRGITIRQPWTTCILAGKDVENRPAPWPWRGLMLLHAGQATERAPSAATRWSHRDPRPHPAHPGRHRRRPPHRLPPGRRRHRPLLEVAQAYAFHLVLADVQELTLPIPWLHGQLGPWRPPQDLVDQVLLQLPHLAPEATS